MARTEKITTLTAGVRQAILDSGMSYNQIAKLAGIGQPQLSRYMSGDRDLTLIVASRVCEVLGFGLARQAPVRDEPLAEPMPTTRRRHQTGEGPTASYTRGQGRRVDLEAGREAEELGAKAARRKSTTRKRPT